MYNHINEVPERTQELVDSSFSNGEDNSEIRDIDSLMNPVLQLAFCHDVGADNLHIYNGHVVATQRECTECYYGQCLYQEIIIGEYSFGEIQRWIDLEREREAEAHYNLNGGADLW